MKFKVDELFCEVLGRILTEQETQEDIGTILYYILKSSLTLSDFHKIYKIVFDTEMERVTKLFIGISKDWRRKNSNDFISFSDYVQLYNSVIKKELYCNFQIFGEEVYSLVRPKTFDDSILYTDFGQVGFALDSFVECGLSKKKLSYEAFCRKYEEKISAIF